MKKLKWLTLCLIVLMSCACDPEGIHVGHVIPSQSTSDHISVSYHDVDLSYDWINGNTRSRSYNYLKSKYSTIPLDKNLVVVGDLSKDIVFLDTIVDSHQVPQVSKYLQDKYMITSAEVKKEPNDGKPSKWVINLLWIFGVISLISVFCYMANTMYSYFEKRRDYYISKKELIISLKSKVRDLKKGDTFDLDKLSKTMKSRFDMPENVIDEVINEVRNETGL